MAFLDFIPLIGSAVSGIASLFGNKQSNDSNLKAQQLANEGNMKLAEYSFNRNLDMWRMNNEYNTPFAQMARLKSAGLNPNLVYGSGSVAGNTSGSVPEYKAPQLQAYTGINYGDFGIGSALKTYQQLRSLQNETDLKNSQEDLNMANEAKSRAEAGLVEERTITERIDQKTKQIQNTLLHLDQVKKHKELHYLIPELENRLNIQQQQLKNLEAQEEQIRSSTDLNRSTISVNDKKKEEIDQSIKESGARITSYLASANLSQAQARKVVADAVSQELRNEIDSENGFLRRVKHTELRQLEEAITNAVLTGDYQYMVNALKRVGAGESGSIVNIWNAIAARIQKDKGRMDR